MPVLASAEELLADEQGPTASEAVSTLTAEGDFLLPSCTVPGGDAGIDRAPVPSEIDILNEIFGSDSSALGESAAQKTQSQPLQQRTFSPRTGVQCDEKTPLLTPLPPLPVVQMESPVEPKKAYFKQTGYADQALAMAASTSSGIAMPREIRITFYPGQSVFSAQALKWVKSFAVHVVNNPTLLAEIRVSEQNWRLQEKRLVILLQVLKEAGVSAHQIRLYKTGRDENTILMGYTQNSEYTLSGNNKNSTERVQKTINW